MADAGGRASGYVPASNCQRIMSNGFCVNLRSPDLQKLGLSVSCRRKCCRHEFPSCMFSSSSSWRIIPGGSREKSTSAPGGQGPGDSAGASPRETPKARWSASAAARP
eukprot:1285544-Pyramimonas_sp.AAC.1